LAIKIIKERIGHYNSYANQVLQNTTDWYVFQGKLSEAEMILFLLESSENLDSPKKYSKMDKVEKPEKTRTNKTSAYDQVIQDIKSLREDVDRLRMKDTGERGY